MKPLISIISVNYKQAEASRAFLKSCQKQTYHPLEIILVDNAPDPVEFPRLKEEFPEVTFIASPKNRGFAGANNLGMQEAQGEFFCFLNNDTEFEEDFITNLHAGFSEKKDLGALSPKILYLQNPETLQFAGYTHIHPLTGRNQTLGQGEKDHGQHDQLRIIPYAHGAAMMVKKEAVAQAGPMPEAFFLYYEELDWSVHIRKAGFSIAYWPMARLYHHASLSTGQDSELKTYYYFRNRVLFMRRNSSPIALAVFLLYFYLILSPAKLVLFLLKGQWTHAKAFLKAISWHFRTH